ncbi:MAG: S8 family peptidase, partial [Halobacteriota archaeon]
MVSANVSRRDLLAGVGTAGIGALLGATGSAAADERTRYNVGTASPAAEAATRQAADRIHRELDWGGGKKTISAWFPETALDGLSNRRDIRYIEEDGEMHALQQEVPWGIERVDATLAHDEGETGAGADIAIIDTGIDSDHEDLEANLGTGHAVVGCTEDCNCFPFACGNDNACHEDWDDDNDHGTHCAGTADAVDNDLGVVGVSTEATLHAVKVLDCEGSGSFSDIAAGIEWTADQGYDVGSMSLGGSASSTVEDAVQYADEEGVLLVAAAGNDGSCSDCVSYPAAYPEVIAVSATDEDDNLADFSSTGPEVELAAPGVDVLSTIPEDDYEYFSGTSMATPHVAGAGGQLMANGLSNTEARQQLADTAEDIGLDDNEQGNGLLDVAAALG